MLVAVIALLGGVAYGFGMWPFAEKERRTPIEISRPADEAPKEEAALPTGPVSPITGLPCDNWNRRPIAVMQPADASARPAAGLSEADMVFEMPVITATINRLMAIYGCSLPKEAGAVRSSRHDFLHIAKGMDVIYVHWGGSHFALDKIKEGILDNIDCTGAAGNSAGQEVCFRVDRLVGMKSEDTSRVNVEAAFERSKVLGYNTENTFSGYKHRAELSVESRPSGGYIRIGYPGSGRVEYAYSKELNAWKRVWGGVEDVDRNNRVRIAPKNIVVLMVESEQIEGQYNNLKFGDPWFDQVDSGDARYYLEGKEYLGSWKKDRSNLGSRLSFLDKDGQEIVFVPGQIWVNVVEPGTGFDWTPQT